VYRAVSSERERERGGRRRQPRIARHLFFVVDLHEIVQLLDRLQNVILEGLEPRHGFELARRRIGVHGVNPARQKEPKGNVERLVACNVQ
jgi:hypothetical protein